MMRIVYNIAGTYNSGGMERVLCRKANYLARRGYQVMIVTTDQQGRPSYFPLDESIECTDLNINYSSLQERGLLLKSIGYVSRQQKHKQRLTRLLQQYKAEVVISMFDHEVSFLHGIQDGSKKVAEIHFSRFKRLQYGRRGLWSRVDQWRSRKEGALAGRYERFVVLTEEDKMHWGTLQNIEVIPNPNSFAPEESALLETRRAIAVGRLDHQKNFRELLEIWNSIHKEFPDWSLDIFGSGPEQQALEQYITKNGLETSVRVLAPVKDIEKEYLESSLLLMTSRYEGLPMALLEGQACGLPLIAYACKCGPRDIIQDGENGFLIPEGERDNFTYKLKTLMRDATLRKTMGAASRMRSRGYSEENIMQRWEQLFEDILVNNQNYMLE